MLLSSRVFVIFCQVSISYFVVNIKLRFLGKPFHLHKVVNERTAHRQGKFLLPPQEVAGNTNNSCILFMSYDDLEQINKCWIHLVDSLLSSIRLNIVEFHFKMSGFHPCSLHHRFYRALDCDTPKHIFLCHTKYIWLILESHSQYFIKKDANRYIENTFDANRSIG